MCRGANGDYGPRVLHHTRCVASVKPPYSFVQVASAEVDEGGGVVTLFHDVASAATGTLDLGYLLAGLGPGTLFGTAIAVAVPYVSVANNADQVCAHFVLQAMLIVNCMTHFREELLPLSCFGQYHFCCAPSDHGIRLHSFRKATLGVQRHSRPAGSSHDA
jgi:hypothetical protein